MIRLSEIFSTHFVLYAQIFYKVVASVASVGWATCCPRRFNFSGSLNVFYCHFYHKI
ncbi:MAG: hypothetical protein J6M43_02830 [Neisseriaceae bacterium]|nr:hypothetical protein [Neisseriaceae bacterium]